MLMCCVKNSKQTEETNREWKEEMRDHLDELNEKSLLERENKSKLIIDSYSIIKRYVVSCLKVCDSVVNNKIENAELSLDDIQRKC